MWFEFGGRNIGRMSLDIAALHDNKQKQQQQENSFEEQTQHEKAQNQFQWRRCGRYRHNFSGHFTTVHISLEEGLYLIGGNGNANNNLHYDNVTIKVKKNMLQEKTFFAAVHLKGKIYTFGGYDGFEKIQLSNCEYYDIKKD